MKTSETGKLGEDMACKYLEGKNYKVIERNFRRKWGELDIITKNKDGTLVFVEVKTIRLRSLADREEAAVLPEDNLTKAKLTKLQRTAQVFAGKHLSLFDDNRGWRIDLVAITLFDEDEPLISHYENI